MQGYHPESAAARGDTRATFTTGLESCGRATTTKIGGHNYATRRGSPCPVSETATETQRNALPDVTIRAAGPTCELMNGVATRNSCASGGCETQRRRAGRTPGTNLSACSYSRSDKHPSVSSVPRDEMKRGAGVSPAALTISPPVPALGELPQRLRPDVSLARASARVDSQLPAAMGIAGTHAAGWDQFDGGAAMQHRSERWAQRGIARGHTKPGRVSGQEILSLPDHTEKSRPQLIANCVSRPAVNPFRPACAEADSPDPE